MISIPDEQFLAAVRPHGLKLDDRYQPPRTLVFENNEMVSLEMNLEPIKARARVVAAFSCIAEDQSIWIYKRASPWAVHPGPGPDYDTALTDLLRLLGIPSEKVTLLCKPEERASAILLALVNLCHARSVNDDLFFVPQSCEVALYFDHDDFVHVLCRNASIRERVEELLQPHF